MLIEKKIVPELRQEVKVKVDIVTSDEIKIYYTGKFQDFTARYIINRKSYFRLSINHIYCRQTVVFIRLLITEGYTSIALVHSICYISINESILDCSIFTFRGIVRVINTYGFIRLSN